MTTFLPRGSIRVLDVDADLSAGIPPAELQLAHAAAVAMVRKINGPTWDPHELVRAPGPGWLGLLVVDGLLLRRVRIGSRAACEILAAGDVLRPWDPDETYDPLPVKTEWRILAPASVAVLDEAFGRRVARWPSVNARLLQRLCSRPRQLTVSQAVTHLPRTHQRLLLMFWLLAERWGTVRPDGILIRLPLTHQVLAMLVGCHRPTVTLALQRLADRGLVFRHARDRWLLTRRAVEYLHEDPIGEATAGAEASHRSSAVTPAVAQPFPEPVVTTTSGPGGDLAWQRPLVSAPLLRGRPGPAGDAERMPASEA
jgi:CRP/FNR family cyclic AMP-dependent transcriptional regulator